MRRMSSKCVELEVVENNTIAVLSLNRPDALNALNVPLTEDFEKAVRQVVQDTKIRAVIVTGKGKAFCAGGDLGAFKASKEPGTFLHDLAAAFHKSVLAIRGMNIPWIAAINGPCFGVGLSLACCCDFRITSATAKFSVAFTGVGLSPDSSLLYYLPKIVGFAKATEMTLLNTIISAEDALRVNLVTKISKPEDLLKDALDMAKFLVNMPTRTLGMDKKQLDASYSLPLEQHLNLELKYVSESATTSDFQEGCQAFFERRKPHFKGI
jgi:2-(1,2-epoxy-1,2-dihydrophenyl)acetyl-CoA isomerase